MREREKHSYGMVIRLRHIIFVSAFLTVSLSLLSTAYASDGDDLESIWEIGMNEAPPHYTEKAFDEFDQHEPFNSHYYTGTMLVNEFPKEINDGNFKQIYIHYDLTDEQANKNLRLFLGTLYATHGTALYFSMRIKIKPPDGNWIEIGEYRFGSGTSRYPEDRDITIDESYVEPGENIILLENANRGWSRHWLIWDSLKLEAFPATTTSTTSTTTTTTTVPTTTTTIPGICGPTALLGISLLPLGLWGLLRRRR